MKHQGEVKPVKRAKDLYTKLLSDENLALALDEVNRTHRWRPHHRPNTVVAWVEANKEQRIKDLRSILIQGFCPAVPTMKRRWDKSSESGATSTSRNCGPTNTSITPSSRYYSP